MHLSTYLTLSRLVATMSRSRLFEMRSVVIAERENQCLSIAPTDADGKSPHVSGPHLFGPVARITGPFEIFFKYADRHAPVNVKKGALHTVRWFPQKCRVQGHNKCALMSVSHRMTQVNRNSVQRRNIRHVLTRKTSLF